MKRKGVELTMVEVAQLDDPIVAAETDLEIHYQTLHPCALTPLLTFIANCRCKKLTIYFEDLDLIKAMELYQAVKANSTLQSVTLDLGSLLAFMEKEVPNDVQAYTLASDISDLFYSNIYQKVHTLIIDYPAINLTQAHLICAGIQTSCKREDTNLQKLYIVCPDLSKTVKEYWQMALQKCSKMTTTFFEASSSYMATSVYAFPEASTVPTFTEDREAGCFIFGGCLASLLTWVWNKPQATEPIPGGRTDFDRQCHRKLS